MISHLDHLVLTVSDIEASVHFYPRVLKMTPITFGHGRKALVFGRQKINLQLLGQESRNRAQVGSGDLCLITNWSMDRVIQHLTEQDVDILEGPCTRSGAQGPIQSVYFCDPDRNLIEISSYET